MMKYEIMVDSRLLDAVSREARVAERHVNLVQPRYL